MEKLFVRAERVLALVMAVIGIGCIIAGIIHLKWHMPFVGVAYISLARTLRNN